MCHVLVIEDDAIAALDIEAALRNAGATSVAIAANEQDAIRFAQERTPSVITSDVMLADGSGPGAISAICRELGDIPVIFITAVPNSCGNEGHAVLEKPFSDRLLEAMFKAVAPSCT